MHTLLSALDQLESIPGSEITPSSVKTPGRARFIASVNYCFLFWGGLRTFQTRVTCGVPIFPKCSATISSVCQRLTACGWETMGAKRTDAEPLHDWRFYWHRPPPPIRELGGSLAHICDVWKPDSTSMSAQAQRAHAGPPKVQTWRLHEGWDAHAQERKDYQSFIHTLDVSGFGKGRKSGHPTR